MFIAYNIKAMATKQALITVYERPLRPFLRSLVGFVRILKEGACLSSYIVRNKIKVNGMV